MHPRIKAWLGNFVLLTASTAVALAFCELVVFGQILKPDDVLPNVTINGVVRYRPEATAVFRHPDRTETVVTINRHGWNSTKLDYPVDKVPGRLRIALIGDSYVHASFVNPDQAFGEIVEQRLKAIGVDAEVYRFGMDGAPLSQYLHVLRREVLRFEPDIVLVQLIHNDFDESYRFLKTRYASSFMKLVRDAKGQVAELPPTQFRAGAADLLRNTATFRYLYYETNLYLHAKSLVSRLWWGGDEEWKPELISSAVDIRRISDHASNRLFARYALTEMARLSERHGFKLALAMDGVREAVYAGKPASDYEVGKLNAIAGEIARELAVPFLDLQGAFESDYRTTGRRFEFPYDWHWNVHGNAVAARAIVDFLLETPGSLRRKETRVLGLATSR